MYGDNVRWVQSASVLHSNGDAMDIGVRDGRIVGCVAGRWTGSTGQPSPEVPDDQYRLILTTGRVVYQFHTRTKTGRAPQLIQAAPDVWGELNPADAAPLGIAEGDTVLVESRRGVVHAPARLPDIRPGPCAEHTRLLQPSADRYGEEAPDEPERLHPTLFTGTRCGALGLLRDLHDLYLMATQSQLCWTVIVQAAQGARDSQLLDVVKRCQPQTTLQVKWLLTRIKQAAPQALVVASDSQAGW